MNTPHRSSSRGCRFLNNPLLPFVPLLAGLFLLSGALRAADAASPKSDANKEVKAAKKSDSVEKTVITGSLIPQRVKASRIPVTASPVTIISQKDIERSGEATLAGVLRKNIPR